MKRSKFFATPGPRYLRANDIINDGVPWQIKDCREALVGEPPVPKPVLHFHGVTRGLILNQTNWDVLEGAFGEESDDWIGHKVVLGVEQGKFRSGAKAGEPYVTIRVRPVAGARYGGGSPLPRRATANGPDEVDS